MPKPVYYNDLPLEKNEIFSELLKISADAIASLKYRAENPHGQTPAEHETAKKLYAKYAGQSIQPATLQPTGMWGYGPTTQQEAETIRRNRETGKKQTAVQSGGRHFMVSTVHTMEGPETMVFETHPDGTPMKMRVGGTYGFDTRVVTHSKRHADMQQAHSHHDAVVDGIKRGDANLTTPQEHY